MPTQIIVPELGESVFEATVAEWLKKEGDPVRAGEALVVLETDKVNFEVTAEQDGTLSKIDHAAGDDVKVGDVLGSIQAGAVDDAQAETVPSGKGAAQTTQASPEATIEFKQPELVTEGAAVQTSDNEASQTAESAAASKQLTPVARRLAEEHGVDIAAVSAQKGDGRITKEDVEAYLSKRDNGKQAALQTQPEKAAVPTTQPTQREERIRMSRRRRTIAERLVEAQQTTAMLTTFNEVDMTAVMDMRTRRKESFRDKFGINLGITSFFVKAAIGALKAFPRVNAELDGDEMILKYHYDIGVAIGAEEGLVVPVLRDADRMTFAEIEEGIKTYAEQANDNTLSLESLRGGTFTITNGGVFGSLLSTPILNPPQVGILGLHKIQPRPIAVDNQVVIRPMMYVALSYDHRIIDGREAVQFLVRLKELVEDPESLLLEG